MIRQRDFRKFQARYHRNGINGAGFYLCRFWFMPSKREVQAVVFDAPGHVAVTTTLEDKWRGDEFEAALREAIAAVEKAQPESLHN